MGEKEIVIAWGKAKRHLSKAVDYVQDREIDDAIYFIWAGAEILANILIDFYEQRYSKDHTEKQNIIKEYYLRGRLQSDYSDLLKYLNSQRLAATLEPYAPPKRFTRKKVEECLRQTEKLCEEIRMLLENEGLI